MKDPLKNRKIKRHIQKAIAEGKCEQCQYPWHDGICSCGKNGEEEKSICELAYSLLKSRKRSFGEECFRAFLMGLKKDHSKEVAKIDVKLKPIDESLGLWEEK